MDTFIYYVDLVIPAFLSILSVICLRKRIRTMCYVTAVLAICAELTPVVINFTSLFVCVSCLGLLLIGDFWPSSSSTARNFTNTTVEADLQLNSR